VDTITNLCRCGTYVRIRRAIACAAREMKAAK
jgi:aerobic-type carbon monoxide dehydrogenase small subunit (CoxS/CutS family)